MFDSGPPILFCHYGNSKYLRYVLPCAAKHNPDRQVVLLGDESNREVAIQSGVQHIPYQEFEYGDDLDRFGHRFQVIKGDASIASDFWLNFVFKRWFMIANLVEREGISSFWHFDSDNMLLEPLSRHEHHFESLDCTEQCLGSCLNGFINNAHVVRQFVQKINLLFEDEDFLQSERERIKVDRREHFNEMVAFCEFKKDCDLKSERLFQIRDNAIFDDAICHCEQFEENQLRTGESMKRLLVTDDGRFFGLLKNRPEQAPIRFASLNLSWVPLYTYRNAYRHSLLRLESDQPVDSMPKDFTEFRDLPIPVSEFIKIRLKKATRPIRRSIKSFLTRRSG